MKITKGDETVAVIADQEITLRDGYTLSKNLDVEPIEIDVLKGDKTACVPLAKVPTMTLINELMSRDGVFAEEVGPYEVKTTYVNGPAVLIISMV